MNSLRIMIVDDSLIIIKKLTQLLETLGHIVVATARNGKEAIEQYDFESVDLVTMDITMPEMDGIEATKAIIRTNPDAKIIMITSHGQEQMVIESIEAGARGYILKPFDAAKIKEVIVKVLTSDTLR